MVVLILCALFELISVGLVVVAVLGFVTSVHRMAVAGRALSALDRLDQEGEQQTRLAS